MLLSPRAITLAAALLAPSAFAQTALCKQFEAQIRWHEMSMAAESAASIGDNSAPRESNRQMRISNSWAAIRTHMAGMQANRCAPLARVVSESTYIGAAIKCATERMGSGGSPSCKRSEWKPEAREPDIE